jgi:7,8-dihydropterin-6-yl-methyl-4-(beta-D-ribofuranosyl)aminobenzene 5'-phosphate synthase
MKLTCLVDNAVKPSSPYWGEHGLSFLIGARDQRILFDTGASGTVLLHNLAVERTSPRDISALALSHGHYDHTGGLVALLPLHPGLPIYAHPGILRERFARQGEKLRSIGLPMDANLLREQAHLHLSREPQEIGPGVWTTGEIGARTEPEGRGEGHSIREGESWIPDPYEDDMALVLQGTEGLVLLCGCCHAGLLNTLHHVQRAFREHPKVIIGGTHLVAADEQHIRHVVGRLQQMGFSALYPNHCTGQAAYVALAMALGSRVSPYPAGSVLTV